MQFFLRASLLVGGLCASTSVLAMDWASLVWQNDLFTGTDGGGYTNGLFLSLYDISDQGDTEYRTPFLARPLAWMLDESPDSLFFSEHSLGQAMVTPSDISRTVPDPDDAPYAGLLLYRVSHAVVEENFADLVRTTIGIVGPSSGAEQMQKLVHKITGSEQPKGWDYQLNDEPVFQLERTAVWRMPLSTHLDTVLLAQAGLGNLESHVGGGAIVRAGRGLEASFATTALHYGRISSPAAIDGGWYLYGGFEASYVFNNILINGNTYRDSAQTDLRHDQLSLTAGFSYSWSDLSVTLSYKTGSSLDAGDKSRDSFGALSMAWRL